MLTTSLTELPDHAALVAHSGGHPVPRWHLPPDAYERGWALGGAVGWLAMAPHGRALFVVGPSAEAGQLATAALALDPVARIIVPAGAEAHVGAPLGEGWAWVWFWADQPPAWRPGENAVHRLAATDLDDVAGLLRVASPQTSVLPGDPGVRSWFGVRDDDGVLVACAAEHQRAPGVWHLRAIASHPRRRGRGLGADVTAAVTRAAFADGAEAVTLGMYADNDVARRMYERLGFRVGESFVTRTVLA